MEWQISSLEACYQTLSDLILEEIRESNIKFEILSNGVTVIIMEANSFIVYISTPLLQLIPMAGRLTEWANQKNILIIRREGG